MAETVELPYIAFRFEVILSLEDPPAGVNNPICNAAFAECDGLEMTMEPKAVREGGNNQEQIHLIGPVSYSQLTLKRGMTSSLELWNWFAVVGQTGRRSVAQGEVKLLDASGQPTLIFVLTNCLPVKLRGPSLNAKDGQIAIEEMQLVYARLSVRSTGTTSSGARSSSSLVVSGGPGLSGGRGSGQSFF